MATQSPGGAAGRHGSAWAWEWEADVDPGAARRLASLIASLYRGNFYHSALHAADVLHAARHVLLSGGLGARLTAQTRVAFIVAAAAHDAGHPGVNNAYVSATSHPLALRYGEDSPLERMHAASLLELVNCYPEADVMASWSGPARRAALKLAFSCIVHTDNAGHFAMVDKVRARAALIEPPEGEAAGQHGGPLMLEPGHEDEDLVLQAVLHASDISNPYRPWRLNCRWGDLVTHEFWLQGRRERTAGLPVSPINDASAAAPKPLVQAGFAKIFCLPLLLGVEALGAADVSQWIAQLKRNVFTYETLGKHARAAMQSRSSGDSDGDGDGDGDDGDEDAAPVAEPATVAGLATVAEADAGVPAQAPALPPPAPPAKDA